MSQADARADAAHGPFDIRRVMAAIPHRYPMLLVDRVEEIVPGESITAVKGVTMNEHFFQGHFPGAPIMPAAKPFKAPRVASYATLRAENSETIEQVLQRIEPRIMAARDAGEDAVHHPRRVCFLM